jgi:hypothetical protein
MQAIVEARLVPRVTHVDELLAARDDRVAEPSPGRHGEGR